MVMHILSRVACVPSRRRRPAIPVISPGTDEHYRRRRRCTRRKNDASYHQSSVRGTHTHVYVRTRWPAARIDRANMLLPTRTPLFSGNHLPCKMAKKNINRGGVDGDKSGVFGGRFVLNILRGQRNTQVLNLYELTNLSTIFDTESHA